MARAAAFELSEVGAMDVAEEGNLRTEPHREQQRAANSSELELDENFVPAVVVGERKRLEVVLGRRRIELPVP